MGIGKTGYVGGTGRKPITPGSLSVEWTIDEVTYSLTDDSEGNLTGDGDGGVHYGFGEIRIKPDPAPRPVDGSYTVTFSQYTGATKLAETITPVQDEITHSVGGVDIRPGSVVMVFFVKRVPAHLEATSPAGAEEVFEETARDDGDGNLWRGDAVIGTVNYAAGSVTFDARLAYNYQYLADEGSEYIERSWRQGNGEEIYDLTQDIQIEYLESTAPDEEITKAIAVPSLKMDMIQGDGRPMIPGSLLFTFGGKTYRDRGGSIITDWDPETDAGTSVGSIDYSTGVAQLDDWAPGIDIAQDPVILACLAWRGERTTYYSKFRTAGAPIRQGSLIVSATLEDGTDVSMQADNAGDFSENFIAQGSVDYETGIVTVEWEEPVFPSSVKYSAVAFSYLPLDAELLGINPTRLPSDGRVPIATPGDVAVISHTIETEVASPTAGATLTFTRDHQAEVWVIGANGETLDPASYTLDREAGELTWEDPLNLVNEEAEAVTTPLTVYDRVEDMVLLTDVQISGHVAFNAALSQDYPAGEAIFSTAVLHGDLRARVFNLFHQSGWTGEWSDERIGSDTTAKYNNIAYPVEITNQGSIKERWRISFTSSTSFQVIGETVGVIGAGDTSTDFAIANPATGAPYFTIRADGWGAGWNSGNQVRFNTDGAQAPFWLARTILSGPATAEEDSFATQNRGDAD